MFEEDKELLDEFIIESREGLAEIESDLLHIEENGANSDSELVNKVFRAVHTIKGTSGFLGLDVIGKLAHALENVLCLMRTGEFVADSAATDLLLKASDTLRELIEDVMNSNEVDVSAHVKALEQLVAEPGSEPSTPSAATDSAEPAEAAATASPETSVHPECPFEVTERQLIEHETNGEFVYVLTFDLIGDLKKHSASPLALLQKIGDTGKLLEGSLDLDDVGNLDNPIPTTLLFKALDAAILDPEIMSRFWSLPEEHFLYLSPPNTGDNISQSTEGEATVVAAQDQIRPDATPADAEETTEASTFSDAKETAVAATVKTSSQSTAAEANVRVSVCVLDRLMNLAGELVLGRNQLLQTIASQDMRALETVGAGLDQVTSELQEAIMETRMQPIGNVFNKYTRIVRDMTNTLKKKCDLIVNGKEVELDKTIIEAIGDPLTHLIRNSVDHGVETPEVRKERGKNPTGTITLSAFHQEGKVNICIEDDGGGLDLVRLKEKAVTNGLITPEQAKEMGDREAARLIFHPGLSTAKEVTDVSGRGVGMDVVRTNLEQIGGSIEVETELRVGTKISVKLPLTLAIIPSLVIRCGENRFAIPQVNISELVRIKAADVHSKIERVKNAEVLRLRGNLLPLVRLGNVLDIAPPSVEEPSDTQNTLDGALNIIVVETGQMQYGVIVDGLHDSEEIVVKPLGRHMAGCSCLAGATVLGDGRVALILDVGGIAAYSQLRTPESDDVKTGLNANSNSNDELLSVLVFTNEPNEQFAVPMSAVTRLERIKTSRIDSIGGQNLIQYRGGALPLISLEQHLNVLPRQEQDRVYTIVFDVGGHEVGLIAPKIVDIRNIPANIDTATFKESGLLGSTIIEGKMSRIVDGFALARAAHPDWFESGQFGKDIKDCSGRILLAEDSDFFREQVTRFMETAGYTVTSFEDGQAAWEALQGNGDQFDLIVSDLEMPNLNGFQFCQRIKTDPVLRNLPVIALTSLSSDADIQRGMECGFDSHQVKLDGEKLLVSIASFLTHNHPKAGLDLERTLETVGTEI